MGLVVRKSLAVEIGWALSGSFDFALRASLRMTEFFGFVKGRELLRSGWQGFNVVRKGRPAHSDGFAVAEFEDDLGGGVAGLGFLVYGEADGSYAGVASSAVAFADGGEVG
jgi:hypothetical protein